MKLFISPDRYPYMLFFNDKDYVPVLFIVNSGIVLNTKVDADDMKI